MQTSKSESHTGRTFISGLKTLTFSVVAVTLAACSSPLKYTPTSGSASSANSGKCASPYEVRKGDSLSLIAQKCEVDMLAIADLNDLPPPYTIYPKQNLILPFSEESDSGDSESSTSKGIQVASARKSSLQSSELGDNSQKTPVAWRWPVAQKLQYKFIRDARGVKSLEIYAKPGTAVLAVAPGEVVYSGNGIVDYGQMLMIKHDDGYLSTYAHNSSLLVQEGSRVKRGQKIALSGATGNTKTAKLYLEARLRGKKVDISRVLRNRP
ncbi:LysM peptidoglycan-binding domain-containing M23 family metallopeptidase [Thiomicrorhabdus sp.]|uniref:LysM peptidoglycan-binding domain-containing M23 family metallopeptidase n=1 Tax=Thiomicrorhabdus sp. TaxID=2039724 RepID=UPI0029C7659F|nr:LysM peptidoglycan-binding domain-containing M23 family metallopeptidase [Thiomicrorhabdus sp.]